MYYYYYHSQKYPDDVIVYVEEVNLEDNTIVIDFLDSNQHRQFTTSLELESATDKTSMVLIKNYKIKKRIQENTAYAIKKDTLKEIANSINIYSENSYLFKYVIDLEDNIKELFSQSVTIGKEDNFTKYGLCKFESIEVKLKGNISVNVRNVGQGNWNEILSNEEVSIVFDAGASMYATKQEIRNIIKEKPKSYFKSKPILFLSHWDKDHYHSLLGMSIEELKCFSFFVCNERVPNQTSQNLFLKILEAIGINNIYTFSNIEKTKKRSPTKLVLISNPKNQLMIFNSMFHKDRNQSGIVLAIKTAKSSIILPGDCHYYQISDYVLPYLNYENETNLIVPHHGGKAGKYKHILNKKIIPNKAIISVGQNHYGHPMKSYISNLKQDKFKILSTKKNNNDILINL